MSIGKRPASTLFRVVRGYLRTSEGTFEGVHDVSDASHEHEKPRALHRLKMASDRPNRESALTSRISLTLLTSPRLVTTSRSTIKTSSPHSFISSEFLPLVRDQLRSAIHSCII